MPRESERYNLSAIRDLLVAAFNADELQELFYFAQSDELKEVVHQFREDDSLPDMVFKAVGYCERNSLLGELLLEVEEANPRKYQEYQLGLRRQFRAPARPARRRIPTWVLLAAGAAIVLIILGIALLDGGDGDRATSTPTEAVVTETTAPATRTPTETVVVEMTTRASVTDYSSYYKGTCPVQRTVSAEIVSNGPAEVVYQWELRDGSVVEKPSPLSFEVAGSQDMLLRWSVDASGVYEVRLHVLSPNNTYSDYAKVEVECEAAAGKIAFVSTRDGNHEIYVMNADGSGQTRLTTDSGRDGNPAWSPDGKRIAFSRDRDDNVDIYVMNADGSGLTRLTYDAARDQLPAWSPEGTRIAFQAGRDGIGQIYVMNADGSEQNNLTDSPDWEGYPAWSPDGRIAIASTRDRNCDVYVVNADGSGLTRLTTDPADDRYAAWSPDGRRIAFTSDRDGNLEIYVMNADGTGLTRLTRDPSQDQAPSWSLDGKRIAFTSWRDGNAEIYVMNADGSGLVRLTTNPATDQSPSWSSR